MSVASKYESHLLIDVRPPDGAVVAKRRAEGLCAHFDIRTPLRDRISLVVSELAANQVYHADNGGQILLRALPGGGAEVIAIDAGPGMEVRSQRPPRHSLGAGLGMVRELSSHVDLFSDASGTIVVATVAPQPPPFRRFGVIAVPDSREAVSGDGFACRQTAHGVQLLVCDGLGHGPRAREASVALVDLFEAEPRKEAILEQAHDALRKTRGAVFALVEIDFQKAELAYASVGNVFGRIYDRAGTRGLANRPGMAGGGPRRTEPVIETTPWTESSKLVLATDGLHSGWRLPPAAEIWQRDPRIVAATLLRDFRREHDDATVAVLVGERSGSDAVCA